MTLHGRNWSGENNELSLGASFTTLKHANLSVIFYDHAAGGQVDIGTCELMKVINDEATLNAHRDAAVLCMRKRSAYHCLNYASMDLFSSLVLYVCEDSNRFSGSVFHALLWIPEV